jgi:hypothetical protein
MFSKYENHPRLGYYDIITPSAAGVQCMPDARATLMPEVVAKPGTKC